MSLDPYRHQAREYAHRAMTGTDSLPFRAMAESGFLPPGKVLDLGCGAGRSSRFLQALGHEVTGVDISPGMIREARSSDPSGTYHLLPDKESLPFPEGSFDAFFSSWALLEEKACLVLVTVLHELARVLRPGGRGVVITNTADFYQGDWVSCGVDFPENRPPLQSGQPVKVRLLPEGVALTDYFWSDADYKDCFCQAGLRVVDELRPLGRASDPLPWKDELRVAPCVVYLLEKQF